VLPLRKAPNHFLRLQLYYLQPLDNVKLAQTIDHKQNINLTKIAADFTFLLAVLPPESAAVQ
jgi:hypothetical protein